MRFPSRHKGRTGQPGIVGTARLDRRTHTLLRRLRPGDIAVIDHLDLDRHNAEALVERGAVAVVNASPFISGRYPNLGPELLTRSGVALLDNVGTGVFSKVGDGATVRLHDGHLFVNGEAVVSGRQLDAGDVRALMDEARSGLSTQLESFTHNTTEFLRREQDLLLHGQGAPVTRTRIEGRPVVIVVRGYDYREDLKRLRRYIREQRPVLIAVDAGADALLAAGHRPDLVVVGESGLAQGSRDGESSGVSEKALRNAREVVLHTDRAGRAVGSERLERLGLHPQVFSAAAASEDVAMLLADQAGASLIVSVGTHATLDEFLDRQRAGLASTFLTRLRVGPKLVDAKGVPALYSGRVRLWQLLVILLAGIVALLAAVGATPVGQDWWTSVQAAFDDFVAWSQGLVS
ncbi:MAG: FIG005773: conserved membrane protein ML1361 [uncultured Nocardioidaceae bacterium]|uniref:FIG005773: conserved membrane protein ML1361 n=1 Tax=uncultured Nocardioidaceae bacterium TaxID=253824 RepID=A0A6J4M8V3_9ACTN|nr:MAG: FIG005773: conserved membrane protein ML1361 [uncultured Nocardioidaceae bacterium]